MTWSLLRVAAPAGLLEMCSEESYERAGHGVTGLPAVAVMARWLGLGLGGLRRRERGWIDAAGLAVGGFWLVLPFSLMLDHVVSRV